MKEYKPTPMEEAIICLAHHIERNPYNEYKVKEQILSILGLEEIKK